jgi:cell division septation protein DedD
MMAVTTLKSLIFVGLVSGLVSGCELGTKGTEITTEPLADGAAAEDATTGDAATGAADGQAAAAVTPSRSVKLVDRDVEAPDDFQTTDKALWDGRPSLGGVWVAATNVKDPMRVIMRNPANGKFVIGALFRREADNPGPKLQISSDAADALGLVAGEPATIAVTALRREEVPATTPDATRPLLDTSETIATETAAAATAAITANPAPEEPATKPAVEPAAPAAEVAAPPAPSAGGASIQIGIFSVEDNAKRAVATLAKAGIAATVRKETSHGKPLWSVIAKGDKALLAKIKKAGFADAYFL